MAKTQQPAPVPPASETRTVELFAGRTGIITALADGSFKGTCPQCPGVICHMGTGLECEVSLGNMVLEHDKAVEAATPILREDGKPAEYGEKPAAKEIPIVPADKFGWADPGVQFLLDRYVIRDRDTDAKFIATRMPRDVLTVDPTEYEIVQFDRVGFSCQATRDRIHAKLGPNRPAAADASRPRQFQPIDASDPDAPKMAGENQK